MGIDIMSHVARCSALTAFLVLSLFSAAAGEAQDFNPASGRQQKAVFLLAQSGPIVEAESIIGAVSEFQPKH